MRVKLRYSLGEYSGFKGKSELNLEERSEAKVQPESVERTVAGWLRSPRVLTLVVSEAALDMDRMTW